MKWLDRLKFWKPKAERISEKRPLPPAPKIDVFGGLRFLTSLGMPGLRRRVTSQAKRLEEAYYGGTCTSSGMATNGRRRRPGSRAAIRPSDRVKELKVSRRSAKPFPKTPEKYLVDGRWVRPGAITAAQAAA